MTSIVVMGVSGCGKSSFGQALAKDLGLAWIEGDDYHLESSRAKMTAGIALDDDDRWPWLDRLKQELQSRPCVVGCSALKQIYRDRLRLANEVKFAYLKLNPQEATRRVQSRQGHFFSSSLVDNQFKTLQEPTSETDVLTLDATQSIEHLIQEFRSFYGKQ